MSDTQTPLADELFDICRELAGQACTADGLRRMHQVLVVACGSFQQGPSFGNLFSQIDWLCKHHGLRAADKMAVQTARRHSNQSEALTTDEWRYDLRAVALFVSALFAVDVPGSLLALLPPTARPADDVPRINRRYTRCIVDHFDDTTIWADTDHGPVAVDYGDTSHGRDLTYLAKILRPGMQLNLLDAADADRPADTPAAERHGGAAMPWLRPALIVVEPDFLVDVSSLAACFTAYGHHPLLYTVNRLKPRANTQAMLLGNFAGAALDAVIHQPQVSTADVLRRAFREQPLRFCACEGFSRQRFKMDAEQQVNNIREAVSQLRPSASLLEPSFICEQLGLQGRVDLMTADMRLLVEQKAGRNMKIERQSHDAHGMQREDHYVQLLLYYGILRYNFQKSDSQVDTRLLYSRYAAEQGLLAVNYYRTLFREAIRLRNQVVATEMLIAREGFGRIAPLLCNDVIYKGVARDGFFQRYVEPQLRDLAALFGSLTPLEHDYFCRMMTFVYREQLCQKLGSGPSSLQHSGGCTADLWQMPLTEKLQTGNIFMALTVTQREKTAPDGGYDLITLQFDKNADAAMPSNFRRGDMVYLYSYTGEPDVRRSILYKGTLLSIGADELTVALNDGQQNPDVFALHSSRQWAVEHAASDMSTVSAIRSLCQFAAASPERRSLLLGQRAPRHDLSRRLSRSYSPAYDDIVLRQKQSLDYFLLVGPPGTGKTSQALRFIVEEELSQQDVGVAADPHGAHGTSVLLTAYTNRAVDEICGMLTEAGIAYLRIGYASSCDARYHHRLLERQPATSIDACRQLISATPVVVGTTSMLASQSYLFQIKHFSLCVVDEASQILEPAIIGLLASDSIGRFVLVGDHKQLPAVVMQSREEAAVSEPSLRAVCLTDCRQSLFERLITWEHHEQRTLFTGILRRQGRMHPDVAHFPNSHFYQREQLLTVPLPHQEEASLLSYPAAPDDRLGQLLCMHRVLFLPAATVEEEAAVVVDVLRRLRSYYADRFDPSRTVGVIVPYRSQIALIRQQLTPADAALADLSVDTVERYQGSQRDVIIYSFAVSRRFQLGFLTANTFFEDGHPIDRKLNVALTRARRQMIMVGNPLILRHSPLFSQLISQYSVEEVVE